MTGPDQEREDRELKARLEKLSGALGQRHQHESAEKARDVQNMARGQETGKAMGLAARMVSELIGGVLVGVGIGWALDKAFSTSPLFIILFALLGTAAGFYNVVKATSPPRNPGKDGPGG